MDRKAVDLGWSDLAVAELPPMVSVDGLAEFLGVSRSTILRGIDRGLIAAFKPEGRIRIPRAAVAAYLGLPINRAVLSGVLKRYPQEVRREAK
ncbi:helix-turn-helix domain-containing protein [Bifidobacterium bifidum]|uniref:helix-turn-helix domain-containing protein n=1 Tax=Bifidobacterium bifidum TaxID=1681 RepID=UPI0032DF5CC7